MIISALSFSFMAAIVKATPHTVAVKALSRQIFSCIFVLIFILINNHRIIPKKENRVKLFLRCLFGTLGIYFYFYSIDNLLLANAAMLTRLSPFFVTLFALLLLKEKINKISLIIFIPLIIGCVLIIKPNSALFNPISIYAIFSACFGALAYTMIKSIGEDESAFTIIFWFTLSSSIIYLLIGIKDIVTISNINLINLSLIGFFGVVGQIGLTYSYQTALASSVAPYSYTYILFSGILGYYIWKEIPDAYSMIGYSIILFSYFILLKYNK